MTPGHKVSRARRMRIRLARISSLTERNLWPVALSSFRVVGREVKMRSLLERPGVCGGLWERLRREQSLGASTGSSKPAHDAPRQVVLSDAENGRAIR